MEFMMKKIFSVLSVTAIMFATNVHAGSIVTTSSPEAAPAQAAKKAPKKKYSTEKDFHQCDGVEGTEAINACLKKSKPLTI